MLHTNQSAPTPYRLEPTDRITVNDVHYRAASTDDKGHYLSRCDDPDIVEFFAHDRLERLLNINRVRVDLGWFRLARLKLRTQKGEDLLRDLPEKVQSKILWKQRFCDELLKLKGLNPHAISLTDEMLEPWLKQIDSKLMAEEEEREGGKARCGKEIKRRKRPAASTFRGWLRKYEAAELNPMALRDDYGKGGNRFTVIQSGQDSKKSNAIDPASRAFAITWAKTYADNRKPTKILIYKKYVAEVDAANAAATINGMRHIRKVARRTFEKLIDEHLTDFEAFAAREGVEKAKKKFAIVCGGLQVTRPLERGEMDEWNISLQALLVKAGLWERLSEDFKKSIERKRVWLSVVFDTATRCILAMRFLHAAPSSASAIAAIEMAVSDKSDLARVIETIAPWDMHGRLESLAMDSGSAFIATSTQAVLRDLGVEPFYPPSGMAALRGRIERLFLTFQTQILAHFPGQTFENVVKKGEYDAEGNAVLDIEELNRVFVRFVVDVYHNSPHMGLGGETPRNAWLRLTNKFGVLPPPSPADRRHIFGIACERRIQNKGIRVLGIHYQSAALQRLRHEVGQKNVLVRVNRYDLGEVSVKTPEGWMDVPPVQDGLRLSGVSYWEWVEAAQQVRRTNANISELSAGIVNAGLASIRDTAEMTIQRAELGSPILSQEDFEKLENDLFKTFRIQGDGTVSDEDMFGDDVPAAVQAAAEYLAQNPITQVAVLDDGDFYAE